MIDDVSAEQASDPSLANDLRDQIAAITRRRGPLLGAVAGHVAPVGYALLRHEPGEALSNRLTLPFRPERRAAATVLTELMLAQIKRWTKLKTDFAMLVGQCNIASPETAARGPIMRSRPQTTRKATAVLYGMIGS